MKDKILKLRKEGKTYNEIAKEIGRAKGTISKYCTEAGLGGAPVRTADVVAMNNYYSTHTKEETAKFFNVSKHYVKKHSTKRFNNQTADEKRKANVLAGKKRRHKIKNDSIEKLGGKCVKCGYSKCKNALDFHHIDPATKLFNMGIAYRYPQKKIDLELNKCMLLCANCHREEHNK